LTTATGLCPAPATARFIEHIFGLRIVHIEHGAMNQTLGRAFSAFLPGFYYAVEPWCPWGMKIYVLEV
jgi:hypothetical protein